MQGMSKDGYPVLILGLDGATFDLMLPWIEQGHLPHLGALLGKGAHSRLESTTPPITPCAWSSFMTGKNPGKHGLFDFVEPLNNQGGFRFTNASSRHAETLWGHLGSKGHRVGVINVPMTYPPQAVNGYLISGLDTPHDGCRYTFPETLRQELSQQSIDYRIDIQYLGNMRTDARRDRKLQQLCEIETTRAEALKYLARKYPADFNVLVFTSTDQVQHHFWHYLDPQHDKYDAVGAQRYGNAIRDVYKHVDGLIGDVLQSFGEQTVVIVMSDHGAGPTTNVRVRLNQALEQAGLLAFKEERIHRVALRRVVGVLDRLLRLTLSNEAKRWLAGVLPRLRAWFESADEGRIDWNRTLAYVNEAYRSSPAVWLLRPADDPRPQQSDADWREETARCVEQVLRGLIDPQTGRPVIDHVCRTRDLYHGPYVEKAPDLLPSWWTDAFLTEVSVPGERADTAVRRSTTLLDCGVEFSGSHRLQGVFMIAGGPARRGHAFSGARIIDVAPTVLYLMGLPIPSDMDGRPLLEALDPAFVAAHPPTMEQGQEPGNPNASVETTFTQQEAEMIEQRLRSLGYIK